MSHDKHSRELGRRASMDNEDPFFRERLEAEKKRVADLSLLKDHDSWMNASVEARHAFSLGIAERFGLALDYRYSAINKNNRHSPTFYIKSRHRDDIELGINLPLKSSGDRRVLLSTYRVMFNGGVFKRVKEKISKIHPSLRVITRSEIERCVNHNMLNEQYYDAGKAAVRIKRDGQLEAIPTNAALDCWYLYLFINVDNNS